MEEDPSRVKSSITTHISFIEASSEKGEENKETKEKEKENEKTFNHAQDSLLSPSLNIVERFHTIQAPHNLITPLSKSLNRTF